MKAASNLTKRIIPCLDVKDGMVVKGVKFKNHVVLGSILDLAKRYRDAGACELVFYDITASSQGRHVAKEWVAKVGEILDIPFCVAGGIRSVEDARAVFNAGADKISINSPAIERPSLISELAATFGSQAVVVGIDSSFNGDDYYIWQYTGSEKTAKSAGKRTLDWAKEVENLGAGEIVLNCMDQDGVRKGYDIEQLSMVREHVKIPLIASGGAGCMADFKEVFEKSAVDGALAASVFHKKEISILELKSYLKENGVPVRLEDTI